MKTHYEYITQGKLDLKEGWFYCGQKHLRKELAHESGPLHVKSQKNLNFAN